MSQDHKEVKKIFLLHGWTYELNKWTQFVNQLKREGFAPVLLQIPGLTSPVAKEWTLHDYTEWLHSKVRKDSPVILVGHSFGGQVALRYAAKFPTYVKQLMLIDSSGIRPHTPLKELKRLLFFGMAKLGRPLKNNTSLRKLLYKATREKDYHDAPAVMRKTMELVLSDEITEDLKDVSCPTTIIWGEKDSVTPIDLGEKIHKGIQNSTFHIVPDARHSPHFTHTGKVVKIIKETIL